MSKLERLVSTIDKLCAVVEKTSGGNNSQRRNLWFHFVAEAILDPKVSNDVVEGLLKTRNQFHTDPLTVGEVEEWLETF